MVKRGSGKATVQGNVGAAPPSIMVAAKGNHAAKKREETPAEIPVKQQLFGSWTGKTPVSLLYEQCQKNGGWGKPQFRMMKKAKGYQCLIILSKEDKKTRERKTISYCPIGVFYESDQEAKHFSATYALHKITSHLSLYRLLPPETREFWQSLEEQRKALPENVAQYEYAADPFAAEEARVKAKNERTERQAARATEAPKAPWLNYPLIHMAAEHRQSVEDVIRSNPIEMPSGDMKGKPSAQLQKALVQLGFREAHVVEALQFRHDHANALDWLCVHVPEDDLPPKFLPEISPEINAQKHTSGSLALEYAVKRLHTAGYSRRLCENALSECDGKEMLALVHLTRKLVNMDEPRHFSLERDDIAQEDIALMQEDEVDALRSIFDQKFRADKSASGNVLAIGFSLDCVEGESTLEIHIPSESKYPFETPGIVIRNEKLPAYIRLSVQKQLGEESLTLLGSPVAFSLYGWLEDKMEALVTAPPPLSSIARGTEMQANGVGSKFSPASIPEIKSTWGARKEKKHSTQPQSHARNSEQESKKLKNTFELKEKDANYQKMFAFRKNLPSYKFRSRILEALDQNQVVIVCGETGCGKSTQVGQFILESMIQSSRGAACNIICTQPRRISALALAERVAAERCEKVGTSVGYSIRGETVRSKDTKLLFCTTGILLRMVQSDPLLSSVSTIIVDEVHERGVDSDFLLIIIRELLHKRNDLKLVLMSATVNSDTFSAYFHGAPVLSIPGYTHPVTDFYLEDIVKNVDYRVDGGNSRRRAPDDEEDASHLEWVRQCSSEGLDESAIATVASLQKAGLINYSLIAAVVRHICTSTSAEDGAILVFMPGVLEIQRCIDLLRKEAREQLLILPLHANLTSKEQGRVFVKAGKGTRKVVVATNIAETSITIDDVVFVIDCGKVKEMQFNGTVQTLTETWASRASCKQRRGRAGRVRPGQCYKLFSKHFEKNKMAADSVPEMLRIPLEQLCLQVKSIGFEDVQTFLGKAVTPPAITNVEIALNVLRDVNAVDRIDDRLTALGKHMAMIPADLRIAKILLFGAMFRCTSAALTIAACMSSKSLFISNMDNRDEARTARERFASDKSDWLTDCKVYHAWENAARNGKRAEREFCETNFLSVITLNAVSDLRKQYLDTLISLEYVPRTYCENDADPSEGNAHTANAKVVKAVLVAGLYPNLARVRLPDVQYDKTAHGSVAVAAKSRDIKFYDQTGGRVFIHPASLNFTQNKFDDPLIVFQQKVSTSKVFLRDTTLCSAWPVLMFGGILKVEHEGRSLSIDGTWRFQAFPRITALVNGLRALLDKVLERKIADPSLDIGSTQVVRVMLELITTEGL
ncbi:hypothetical protein PhCBS80983_g00252 [Powellomyces hirtus]|uniref:RNA helicase n=1 Tax=Powellomyces hirtus TaxID=109895 RepID=A0A507EGX8_9FUNG|nr:hypothetical protein PhCBS80983_g00252 [Powellomyces hirtus]